MLKNFAEYIFSNFDELFLKISLLFVYINTWSHSRQSVYKQLWQRPRVTCALKILEYFDSLLSTDHISIYCKL